MQSKLHESITQRPFPKTSSNSLDSTQTGQPSGDDWQEEVYQKIKAMKESYLPELSEMYQKIDTKLQQHDSLPHQLNADQIDKLKVFKMMLDRLLAFLQLSKSIIAPNIKEKLDSYEKQIITFINTNRPRKRKMSSLQPGQLPSPDMHYMSQTQPQVTQVQESIEERLKLVIDNLVDMQQQVVQVKSNLESEKKSREQHDKSLNNELNKLKEEIKGLKCDVGVSRRKISELEKELVEHKQHNEELKMNIALNHQVGFDKALAQVSVLFPELDLSSVNIFKNVVDGKLITSASSIKIEKDNA